MQVRCNLKRILKLAKSFLMIRSGFGGNGGSVIGFDRRLPGFEEGGVAP